jgi:hypothetical protein
VEKGILQERKIDKMTEPLLKVHASVLGRKMVLNFNVREHWNLYIHIQYIHTYITDAHT